MFDINEFKGNINNNGFVPTNRYYVEFNSPALMQRSTINVNGLAVKSADIGKLLQFRAESVRAPGIVVSTSQNQRYGFGPTQQMPTNVNFTNISVSFLADSRGLIWGYFYQWLNTVFGFDEVTTNPDVNADFNSFRVNYKVDYVSDMTIKIFDHGEKLVTSITLRDAFPISMNDVSLAWDANNQLKRITISFAYRSWKMNGTDTNADTLANVPITPKHLNIPRYSVVPGYNYPT